MRIPSLNLINMSFLNTKLSMFIIETQQTKSSKKASEHFFLEALYTIQKLVKRKIVLLPPVMEFSFSQRLSIWNAIPYFVINNLIDFCDIWGSKTLLFS